MTPCPAQIGENLRRYSLLRPVLRAPSAPWMQGGDEAGALPRQLGGGEGIKGRRLRGGGCQPPCSGGSERFETRIPPIPWWSSIRKQGGKKSAPHMSVFLRRLTAALPGRVRGGLPEIALISMQAAPGARSGARGWRGRGRRRRGAVGRRRVCCRGIFPLWDLPGPVATEQAAVAVMGRRRLPLNASNKWAAGGSRAAGAAAVPAVPRWASPPPPPGKAPGRTVAGGAGAPRMPRPRAGGPAAAEAPRWPGGPSRERRRP